MSGHSKWATIKHKKAALDAKRGKEFTRLIKEIRSPRAAAAIRMPTRACAPPSRRRKPSACPPTTSNAPSCAAPANSKAARSTRVMFEGYGPGGAAVLVDVATDNRNRTVSEIRHVFSKNGGNMGEQGSVAWMFERKSQIIVDGERCRRRSVDGHRARCRRRRYAGQGGAWEILSPPKRTKRC